MPALDLNFDVDYSSQTLTCGKNTTSGVLLNRDGHQVNVTIDFKLKKMNVSRNARHVVVDFADVIKYEVQDEKLAVTIGEITYFFTCIEGKELHLWQKEFARLMLLKEKK